MSGGGMSGVYSSRQVMVLDFYTACATEDDVVTNGQLLYKLVSVLKMVEGVRPARVSGSTRVRLLLSRDGATDLFTQVKLRQIFGVVVCSVVVDDIVDGARSQVASLRDTFIKKHPEIEWLVQAIQHGVADTSTGDAHVFLTHYKEGIGNHWVNKRIEKEELFNVK